MAAMWSGASRATFIARAAKLVSRLSSMGVVLAAGCRAPEAGPIRLPPSISSPPELELERSLTIESVGDFEPSGLAFVDDKLVTVSDKDDSTVYQIVLGATSASLRPFVTFTAPVDDGPALDLEGIAVDTDGSLLLASEGRCRVLRVDRTGTAQWVTPSLQAIGRRAGLFQKHNAGLEGIARLPHGSLLLAAEREPRGLVEIPPSGDSSRAESWATPHSRYLVPAGRNEDFADLAVIDRDVYALERNSHLVVRIERQNDGWVEGPAWSYARTEDDPRFAYRGSRYGMAEGLAFDREHVFVVMDNNYLARASAPTDRRPQLFVFRRPPR
jgi:hypothetical protein